MPSHMAWCFSTMFTVGTSPSKGHWEVQHPIFWKIKEYGVLNHSIPGVPFSHREEGVHGGWERKTKDGLSLFIEPDCLANHAINSIRMESPSITTKPESTLEGLVAGLSPWSFLDLPEDKAMSQFAVRWQGVDFCLSRLPHRPWLPLPSLARSFQYPYN